LSQIDLVVCEVVALNPRSNRVPQLLDTLWELHLYRGSRGVDRTIMEGLKHVAMMSALRPSRLQALVAKKLWEMCFHFVGPEHVRMNQRDLAYVLDAIEGLETLASLNASVGQKADYIDDIMEAAQGFFEIGLWYQKTEIADKVIDLHAQAIDGCYDNGVLRFTRGRPPVRRSLRELDGLLEGQREEWRTQEAAIRDLLAADQARAKNASRLRRSRSA
jgi:hypothetical protein